MNGKLAGTVIDADEVGEGKARQLVSSIFVAGGLYLSQICELLGVKSYDVQNWVKRGFVSPPQNKRYTKRQFCRLVTINAFKDILEMKDIVGFISYINGDLSDESDDLLADDELYFCFSDCIARLSDMPLSEESIDTVCKEMSKGYSCAEKLYPVLKITVNAYFADLLRKEAEKTINKLYNI